MSKYEWLRNGIPGRGLFMVDKGGEEDASEQVNEAKDGGSVSDRAELWLPLQLESRLWDLGSEVVCSAGEPGGEDCGDSVC